MAIQSNFPAIRPSLNLDFANTKQLDPRITFTRASSATYFDANGVMKTTPSGVARFDHNPETGESLGLLIEEQRTNLLLRSEEFNSASWTKAEVTVTANATTSPDGTANADLLVPSTNASAHQAYQQIAMTNGTDYTYTVYAKAGGYAYVNLRFGGGIGSEAFFDLSIGTVVSATTLANASIAPVGNGWYRCSYTATATSTTSFAVSINPCPTSSSYGVAGNGTSGIFVWGAQLEVGAFPTSYIPTVASEVTRSADVASMSGSNFSGWFNSTQGAFFALAKTQALTAGNPRILGGASFAMSGVLYTTTGAPQNVGTYNFAHNLSNNSSAGTFANGCKAAMAYSPSGRAVTKGGHAVASDAYPLIEGANTATDLLIGSGGGAPLNGTIARLAYYPKRLTNANLQALTS